MTVEGGLGGRVRDHHRFYARVNSA